MRNFEVLKRNGDRWVLAAVFDDPAVAISDAKALIERSRGPMSVEVLAVENRKTEFVEWVVYRDTKVVEVAPLEQPADGEAPPETVGTEKDTAGEPIHDAGDAAASPRRRRIKRAPKDKPVAAPKRSYGMLVALGLALGGIAALAAHQLLRPQSPWIFDTPEAQKHHALRNPWTGETSR